MRCGMAEPWGYMCNAHKRLLGTRMVGGWIMYLVVLVCNLLKTKKKKCLRTIRLGGMCVCVCGGGDSNGMPDMDRGRI